MAYVLFFLALVALLAGLWLWNADARERRARAESAAAEPIAAPKREAAGVAEAPGAESAPRREAAEEMPAEPEPAAEPVAGPGAETARPAAEPMTAADPEPAPKPAAPAATEVPEAEVSKLAALEPGSVPNPEPAPRSELGPKPKPKPKPEPEAVPASGPAPTPQPQPLATQPQPRPHRRSGLQLPGASRRERRAWADARGYEFAKEDDLLAGEWRRGAASEGASARDVVSGQVYGHDTHLADLGRTTVIAMGTGESSNVVVDMRRDGFAAASSADLVEVAREGGFTIYGTEAGPVCRFIDARVTTALAELPPEVVAVWCEGAWTIAQLAPDSAPAQWDAALAPLALLADAARTLPPAHPRPLRPPYQTRAVPDALGEKRPAPAAAQAGPVVQRPEEPLEMPTRTTGASRGSVEPRAIGGDEIAPIADSGAPAGDVAAGDLTKVRRKAKPPSIFEDKEH